MPNTHPLYLCTRRTSPPCLEPFPAPLCPRCLRPAPGAPTGNGENNPSTCCLPHLLPPPPAAPPPTCRLPHLLPPPHPAPAHTPCRLASLEALTGLTGLVQLSVEDNELSSLAGVERLAGLMELYAGEGTGVHSVKAVGGGG